MFGIKLKMDKKTETKKEPGKPGTNKELPAFPGFETIPKTQHLFSVFDLEMQEKASKDPLMKIEALKREINGLESDSEALTNKSDKTIDQLKEIIDKQKKIHEALQILAKKVESAYIKNHWGLETNIMHLNYKMKTAERRAQLPGDIQAYQESTYEAPDNAAERQNNVIHS